jgi:CIC family chloride channel protein
MFGDLYISFFYKTQAWFTTIFQKYSLPQYLKPVLGALLLGIVVLLLSCISPEAKMLGLAGMGASYGYTQLMFYSMVPLIVLIFLPFVKILFTSLTLGSGGSGGVFAPGLTIGAAIGGAFGTVLHLFDPTLVPIESVPVFVAVGMVSLFGAVANAPIAVLVMVVEMVGSVTILVPSMAAVAISHLLTGEKTIFREQVPTRAQSGAHRGEYDRNILERILVRDAMIPRRSIITFSPSDEPANVLETIGETEHTGFPVVEDGRLVGIITNQDVRATTSMEGVYPTVGETMTLDLSVIHPEDTLEDALELMISNNFNHLPVVEKESSDQLSGFLTRTDIMKAYARSNHSAIHN